MQQQWNVTGLGTRQFYQLVDVALVGEPGLWVFAVIGVGVQGHFGERGDDLRVLLGEILAHDPGIEGRCAELGQLAGGDQHFAVFLGDTEGRIPNVRGVDVTAFPGGNDRGWSQVENGDFRRIDVPVLQRGEQAVVAGGYKRHGDFLADQVLRGLDPGTVAGDQGFGGADLGGDEEGLHRDFAGDCRRQGAGAEVADLYVAGSDGGDDVGTVIEFSPADVGLGGFFISAVGLGDFRRVHGGLVSDSDVSRLGKHTRRSQRSGSQQAKRESQFHRVAPCQATECRRERRLNDLRIRK
ncbi:hypothetical protein D3C87_1262090 [compost metagenome]